MQNEVEIEKDGPAHELDEGSEGSSEVPELAIRGGSEEEASASGRTWGELCAQVPTVIWGSGMTCMALASFFQSVASLCVKLTDGRVPVFEIVFVRSAICMAGTMALIRWRGISPVFGQPESYVALLIRGGAGATSMSVYYFAIMQLPLADVMTLFFTHPAMVVGLAWLCRGEAVRWTGLVGMLLSLLGVAAVAQPPFLAGGSVWSTQHVKGVANSLLAAVLAAIAFVAIRYVPKSESSLSIALSFHTMGVITSGIPLAAGISGHAVIPGLLDCALLLTIAFCSVTSHNFIARAFQVEKAGKSAAAGYLQVVFGYLYSIFIFKDSLTLLSILGSAVICMGVVAVSWPSKKSADMEDEARKTPTTDFFATEESHLIELTQDDGKSSSR